MADVSGGRRGRTRWFALAALVAVAGLYIGHLFFFCAGSSLWGDLSWRLDRGRLTVRETPGRRPQPFWVELGSAGIKLSVEWHDFPDRGCVLHVPLWIPLGLCLAWCAVSWRRRATGPSAAGS